MRNISLRAIMILILLVVFVGCGGGGGSASIQGYVNGFSDGYLEGVKVDVGGKAQTVTDAYGFFQTPQFPLGTYTMSFTKDGYWTLNFSVTFDQPGSFQFNNTICLGKVNSGTGTIVAPSFIQELYVSNYSNSYNPHITVNAENQVNSLIAIPYSIFGHQSFSNPHIYITTDSGTNISSTITFGKTARPLGDTIDFEEHLREYKQRISQQMVSKGIKPGVPQYSLRAKAAESQLTFYKIVNFTEYPTYTTVTANLKYNGVKCLIYLDQSQNIADSYIQQLGQAFDNFHDLVIQYFGDLTVNIDNYNKVYILLTELPHSDSGTILGYFDPLNEYPEIYSNEKEMLYMTTFEYNTKPDDWLKAITSTSAHEFQHLINYSCRGGIGETDTWINEGLSMMAEEIAIAGPGMHNPFLDQRVIMYLKYHTNDCLQDWQGDLLDYASAYMFMRYYADRFGEAKLRDINTASSYYPDENSLAQIAGVSNFNELFKDWLTAVILDAIGYTTSDSVLRQKYLYKTLDLSTYDFPKDTTGYISMTDGAGAFIYMPDLEAAKRIDIDISGDYYFGMRVIMLPTSEASFSASDTPGFSKIH